MDLSPADYCRQIETYLCRKNDGHLIRIVGPAFEQVCGWAERGVPIKVAFHGIDRYFERYYAKGPKRRPVRVEFCEADVLDVFDEWRRAVGVPTTSVAHGDNTDGDAADVEAGGPKPPRHLTLPAHLDRVIARLTSLRAGSARGFDELLDSTVRELDTARAGAKSLRGEARQTFLGRLSAIDRSLLEAARQQCDAATLRQLQAEAGAELAPFRDRMPRDAYDQALRAAVDRLIRDRMRLPIVRFE